MTTQEQPYLYTLEYANESLVTTMRCMAPLPGLTMSVNAELAEPYKETTLSASLAGMLHFEMQGKQQC
jgi:hypothetical protein